MFLIKFLKIYLNLFQNFSKIALKLRKFVVFLKLYTSKSLFSFSQVDPKFA